MTLTQVQKWLREQSLTPATAMRACRELANVVAHYRPQTHVETYALTEIVELAEGRAKQDDATNPIRFRVRNEGKPTPEHQTIRVFSNGASGGLLTLTHTEARELRKRLTGHPEDVEATR